MAVSSDNGLNWTNTAISGVRSIAASSTLIVGVNTLATTTTYKTSTDGINWTSGTLPLSTSWSNVGYGSGKGFVVVDNISNCSFSATGT